MSSIIIRREVTGTLSEAETLSGQLSAAEAISGEMSAAESLAGTLTVPSSTGGNPYSGSYTVTPTQDTQTLATEGKTLSQNITINPIPSNYGLITWNGAYLTVS